MCENITKKYLDTLDIDNINIIKNKLLKNSENPKLVIIPIKLPHKRTINIIQDGVLIAGTKQRVAKMFFKELLKDDSSIKTVVYTGSSYGFGPVATAYGAYKLGLKSEIFLDGIKDNSIHTRQINTLQALGAKIYLCPSWDETKQFMYNMIHPNWKLKKGYYIVPMGLNDGNMTDLLSKQIIKASKNTIIDIINPRIWLVAGSGGIAMSLLKAFPNAKLFIYLTGHGKHKQNVINWAKNKHNVTIIKPIYFGEEEKKLREDRHLYYDSVEGYDDLIWPYIKKNALDGDFIWNIASSFF